MTIRVFLSLQHQRQHHHQEEIFLFFFFNPEWLQTALLPKLRAPKIIAEMLLCWTPSYIFFFSPGKFQVSSFHFILFFSNLFCNPGVLGDVLSALCPEVCLLHSF